jgi:chaperonin cofactor prefoldin
MKDDKNGQVEFGVMAQEINKVFPELVKIDESTAEKYMSVNYVGLIAPLIEASKELKSENESLKAQIGSIEQRMASIEGDMNGMKAHTGYGIGKAQMGLGMILGMLLMGGMAGVAMIVVNRRRRQP